MLRLGMLLTGKLRSAITSIEEADPEDGLDIGKVDKEEANHLNAVNAVLRCKG
jgi:hypothetical protein